jgi:hypothetical protein
MRVRKREREKKKGGKEGLAGVALFIVIIFGQHRPEHRTQFNCLPETFFSHST